VSGIFVRKGKGERQYVKIPGGGAGDLERRGDYNKFRGLLEGKRACGLVIANYSQKRKKKLEEGVKERKKGESRRIHYNLGGGRENLLTCDHYYFSHYLLKKKWKR